MNPLKFQVFSNIVSKERINFFLKRNSGNCCLHIHCSPFFNISHFNWSKHEKIPTVTNINRFKMYTSTVAFRGEYATNFSQMQRPVSTLKPYYTTIILFYEVGTSILSYTCTAVYSRKDKCFIQYCKQHSIWNKVRNTKYLT